MPVYNITVDDSSPMIAYSPGWVDSNPSDPQLSSYFQKTFHTTSLKGATASVSFFGNAVYLYGAIRHNYGPFNVTLDGQTISHDAAFLGNAEFQQVLFASTGLSNSEHNLVITNAGNGTVVDVDSITFTTGDGDTSVNATFSTIDDSSPLITYSPSTSAWQTTGLNQSLYFNSTLHASQAQGAQVTIPFNGDAVAVYGATDQSHGIFTVKIDDRPAVSLNGSAPSFRPQTLLYWAGALQHGQHTVTVTNTHNASFLDLDNVGVASWVSYSASTLANTTSSSSTSVPVTVGVVSGTCILFAWIVALVFILRARRRRRHEAHLEEATLHPFILPAIEQVSQQPRTPSGNEAPTRPIYVAPSGITSSGTGPLTNRQYGTITTLSLPIRHASISSLSVYSTSSFGSGSQAGDRSVAPSLILEQSAGRRGTFGEPESTGLSTIVHDPRHDLRQLPRENDDRDSDSNPDERPPDYAEAMPRHPPVRHF